MAEVAEVTMDCRQCDAVDTITVPRQSFEAYMADGSAAVDVMLPSLSAQDRELLMQARRKRRDGFHWYLCPTCWESL